MVTAAVLASLPVIPILGLTDEDGVFIKSGDDIADEDRPELSELASLASQAADDEVRFAEVEQMLEARMLAASYSRMAMVTSGGAWEPYRHLVYLNRQLRRLAQRKIRRLLVTMPPRHGKSWTCSKHFPASYLSEFPDHRVILTSYEADFAAQWGGYTRDLIEQNAGLLGISVKSTSKARDRWDLVGRQGGMSTAGMGGPITGKGAHLLIIDDPVKNAEEADSEAIQERNWNWYLSTAHTRLEPGGVVLLVMTRWNEADLGGKILDEHGDEWEVVNLPALAEDDDPIGRERGEALCPQRYDVEDLGKIRTTVGSRVWSALYQQRPTTEGGGRFKRKNFRYWDQAEEAADGRVYYRLLNPDGVDNELVARSDCWRFSTMDIAGTLKKRSDFTVISTWDVAPLEPTRLLLVARLRTKVETTSHLGLMEQTFAHLKPLWMGVDSNAIGLSAFQSAKRKGLPVRELDQDRDKWARSEVGETLLEAGRVYWPRSIDWLAEWEHELLIFPNGAHDDQVDTFSAAAIELDRRRAHKKQKRELSHKDQILRLNRKKIRHPSLGAV